MSFGSPLRPSRRAFLAGMAGLTATALGTGQQLASPPPASAPDSFAEKKKLLAIGDVHTAYQHDSVSHALATIERLGRQSAEFVTFIRTDTQLLTKSDIYGAGRYSAPPAGTRRTNAKNLIYFDAIFFFGLGEEELSAQQKADLLAFVHDDGKGFVGAHSAIDAFYNWPQYGEIMGPLLRQSPVGRQGRTHHR